MGDRRWGTHLRSSVSYLLHFVNRLPSVVIANVKWPFPTPMAPHVPTPSFGWTNGTKHQPTALPCCFWIAPRFSCFPADPALVCHLQDYVPTYSSVFLPPVDPWRRFSFLASFRKIIRKPDIFAFCPIGRHYTWAAYTCFLPGLPLDYHRDAASAPSETAWTRHTSLHPRNGGRNT